MTVLCSDIHMSTGQVIVQIFDDQGHLLAVIYPVKGNNAIHIVSKHFDSAPLEPSHGILDVPGYLLKFKSP
jgi:hypothetical protein